MSKQYPLASNPDEINRLRIQADSLREETMVMLNRIQSCIGGRSLDLGCGAGGITDLLSEKVGPSGSVLGVDMDDYSLAAARAWAAEKGLNNVQYQNGNLFDLDLMPETFDIVHLRYVMTTIGRDKEVIGAALSLLKPGGILAIQEADAEGIQAFPESTAFNELKKLLIEVFNLVGGDPYAGCGLYANMVEAGLKNINIRTCTASARSTDPIADFLPQSTLSAIPAFEKTGLRDKAELENLVAQCRRDIANPLRITTTSRVFQVWGQK